MKHAPIELKGRLDGAQRTRLKSLLDMLYRPSEIAEIVGFNVRQVYRVYVPLGCPHTRDDLHHIWINGVAFATWFEATYPKLTLKDDEAFCLTCKAAVSIIAGVEEQSGQYVYTSSQCPICGRKLACILRKVQDV